MARRTTPTPCSQLEMAGGPRRGPPSETSLGGNRQGEPSSTGESPERHQVEKRPPKQTDLRGEGEKQQGQKKKKGQDPLLRWLEGYRQSPRQKQRQLNVEPSPLQSRLADQRMTKTEDRPEKHSQEPNCSNSFTRDQNVTFRPEKGDPILKEYRPDIQRRLRFDRVGEKPLSTLWVAPLRSNYG